MGYAKIAMTVRNSKISLNRIFSLRISYFLINSKKFDAAVLRLCGSSRMLYVECNQCLMFNVDCSVNNDGAEVEG